MSKLNDEAGDIAEEFFREHGYVVPRRAKLVMSRSSFEHLQKSAPHLDPEDFILVDPLEDEEDLGW